MIVVFSVVEFKFSRDVVLSRFGEFFGIGFFCFGFELVVVTVLSLGFEDSESVFFGFFSYVGFFVFEGWVRVEGGFRVGIWYLRLTVRSTGVGWGSRERSVGSGVGGLGGSFGFFVYLLRGLG